MATVKAPRGFPTKVKVGSHLLRIRWFDAKEEDKKQNAGYFCSNLHEIGVGVTLHPIRIWEILWHEIQHVITIFMDAKEVLDQEDLSQYGGKGMTMVMIDNPGLYRFMGKMLFDKKRHERWKPDPYWASDREVVA